MTEGRPSLCAARETVHKAASSLVRGSSNPARDWAEFRAGLDTMEAELARYEQARQEDADRIGALCQAAHRHDEEVFDLRELLRAAYTYLSRFVDTETALVDGFDVHAWCEQAELLGGAMSRERGENPAYGSGNPDWERDFERTADGE